MAANSNNAIGTPSTSNHRLEVERESREKGVCPSCDNQTFGSRSMSTGMNYPYCAKCMTRATPATDSYAALARGSDRGPFEFLTKKY